MSGVITWGAHGHRSWTAAPSAGPEQPAAGRAPRPAQRVGLSLLVATPLPVIRSTTLAARFGERRRRSVPPARQFVPFRVTRSEPVPRRILPSRAAAFTRAGQRPAFAGASRAATLARRFFTANLKLSGTAGGSGERLRAGPARGRCEAPRLAWAWGGPVGAWCSVGGRGRGDADRDDGGVVRRRGRVGDAVEAGVRRAASEAAVGAVAPTAHRAGGERRAGGVVRGGQSDGRGAEAPAADPGGARADARRRIAELRRGAVEAGVGGALAELALIAPAPAPHVAVGGDRAGVRVAGGDRDGRHDRGLGEILLRDARGLELDDGRGVRGARTRARADPVEAVVVAAGAELAGEVRAPARDRAVHEQGARVGAARGDRDGCSRQGHDAGVVGACRAADAVEAVVGGARAQAAECAVAPAPHRARGHERAGVLRAGADRRGRAVEGHRARVVRRAVGEAVEAVCRLAAPELTVGAVAPAAHGTADHERAGEVPARRDCGRGAAERDGRRVVGSRGPDHPVGAVVPRAAAELAGAALAPATHGPRGREHAGVRVAAGDRGDGSEGRRAGRGSRPREERDRRPVPEPARRPLPPAARGAAPFDRAGVGAPEIEERASGR